MAAPVVIATVVLVSALAWADAQRGARVAQARAAGARTTAALGAARADATAGAAETSVVTARTGAAQRAGVTEEAAQALAGTRELAGSAPHAGEAISPLLSAAGAVAGTLTTRFSPTSLRTELDRLAVAQDEVVAAEAQWQAAEEARAAAEDAADEHARTTGRRVAPTPDGTPETTASSQAETVADSSAAPRTALPSTLSGQVPAVAACGTPTGGRPVVSSAALGQAINTWREGQGLPTLAVATSGTLTGHALGMAASGSIWHSGSDNIVGCAGSAQALVDSWAASQPHRDQLARTDVTTMRVGAATDGPYLYGAIRFG